jgi:hypothetical protein
MSVDKIFSQGYKAAYFVFNMKNYHCYFGVHVTIYKVHENAFELQYDIVDFLLESDVQDSHEGQ